MYCLIGQIVVGVISCALIGYFTRLFFRYLILRPYFDKYEHMYKGMYHDEGYNSELSHLWQAIRKLESKGELNCPTSSSRKKNTLKS